MKPCFRAVLGNDYECLSPLISSLKWNLMINCTLSNGFCLSLTCFGFGFLRTYYSYENKSESLCDKITNDTGFWHFDFQLNFPPSYSVSIGPVISPIKSMKFSFTISIAIYKSNDCTVLYYQCVCDG